MAVTTKSALVLRDLDLLGAMVADRCAAVQLSIATLDAGLARHLEPCAASSQRRLEVIHELTQAGIPTGVLVSPLIPGLRIKTWSGCWRPRHGRVRLAPGAC